MLEVKHMDLRFLLELSVSVPLPPLWIPTLELCLRVSIAVINHHDQKQPGGAEDLFHLACSPLARELRIRQSSQGPRGMN